MNQEPLSSKNSEQGAAKLTGGVLFGPGKVADMHEARHHAERCPSSLERGK